ncbi:MAG: hypothetical protein QQN63_12030 [Nitrosopumilus sp.]
MKLRDRKLTILTTTIGSVAAFYFLVRWLALGDEYIYELKWIWAPTIVILSLTYIGISLVLTRRGVVDLDVFIVSFTSVVSLTYSYELIFHYSFPVYLNYFRPPFIDLSDLRTGITLGISAILIVVGHKYLRIRGNYPLLISALIFVGLWIFWLGIGFPQKFSEELFFPRFLPIDNAQNLAWSLNILTKIVLAVSYLFLFIQILPSKTASK